MLKTAHPAMASAGVCASGGVQLHIDPARVPDRQVISGEVAAGLVVAPGRNPGIGLPSPVRPTRGAEIGSVVTPLAALSGFCPVCLAVQQKTRSGSDLPALAYAPTGSGSRTPVIGVSHPKSSFVSPFTIAKNRF